MAYRIAKWNEVFERAESRKLKVLTWVAMPTGFTSNGYQLMLDEFGPEAPAIYGAWCALVSVAASCSDRGVLANGQGIPLKLSHIARMTGFPVSVFEKLTNWASRKEVGWLIDVSENSRSENRENFRENSTSGESPDDPPINSCYNGGIPQAHDPTQQDTTKPNQTKHGRLTSDVSAREGVGRSDVDAQKFVLVEEGLDLAVHRFRRTCKIVAPSPKEPQRSKDLDLMAKAAILSISVFCEDWLADACEAVRINRSHKPPCAYFFGVLKSKAETMFDAKFTQQLARTVVPTEFYEVANESI